MHKTIDLQGLLSIKQNCFCISLFCVLSQSIIDCTRNSIIFIYIVAQSIISLSMQEGCAFLELFQPWLIEKYSLFSCLVCCHQCKFLELFPCKKIFQFLYLSCCSCMMIKRMHLFITGSGVHMKLLNIIFICYPANRR